ADIQAIISLYGHRKADMALMDFDDLLLHLKRLLVEHPDVRARWADTFEHVLVDEYQDTNHLQGQLVDLLAAGHGNVMVVGDDCQSIYAFRGADYHNILEFPERYPGCQRFRLEINYRSTPQILELANQSIARNTKQFEKTLRAERPKGPQPALVEVRDVFQQAEFVCQRILELVDEGISMREIAVLYRAHHHSMELQVEMTKRNIPFTVRSGMRFFEQAHIKDVLSYLRLMYNPRDELAFMRLAHHWRGIGARRAQDIWTYVHAQTDPLTALCDDALARALPGRAKSSWQDAATVFATLRAQRLTASPADMIDTVMHGGYIEVAQRTFDNADHRLGDLEQLTNYAAQYDELDRFLGEISLLSGLSSRDIAVGEGAPDELVTLTSIHQAKGLEWSACFVLWLSDGHFPSERATREVDGLEEERRLFYVASTRAKDDLYLCHPYTQYVRGQGTAILRPSPFILELEDHDDAGHEPWERWTIDAS
ncbi:MAG: ATP-dependent helicase, partial [Myxococcota bacterium]